MRDLTTIAAVEQETRKQLKDLRLAMRNKRDSLARDEAEEATLLERAEELQREALACFEATRAAGLAEQSAFSEAS